MGPAVKSRLVVSGQAVETNFRRDTVARFGRPPITPPIFLNSAEIFRFDRFNFSGRRRRELFRCRLLSVCVLRTINSVFSSPLNVVFSVFAVDQLIELNGLLCSAKVDMGGGQLLTRTRTIIFTRLLQRQMFREKKPARVCET